VDARLLAPSNPAGCPVTADGYHAPVPLEDLGGKFPVEDFQRMLGEEFPHRHSTAKCSDKNRGKKWCPLPKTTGLYEPGSPLTKAAEDYLRKELKGTDASKPLVVTVYESHTTRHLREETNGFIKVQVASFFCGLERLGLLDRTVVFATDPYSVEELHLISPKLRVVLSDDIINVRKAAAERTGLDRNENDQNRVLKMVASKLLLNIGRELILTDMDMYWVRDPSVPLQKAAREDGVELAAMKDLCWLELNSGFMYYRSTPAVRRMLDIAMATYRPKDLCADQDQYLVNCGFAHAAVDGLNYRMLPTSSFAVGTSPAVGGSKGCSKGGVRMIKDATPSYIGDGEPYVWHTYGFSTHYEPELDMFAAFGFVDVDVHTGKCLPGPRGSTEHAQELRNMSAMNCWDGPGGLLHAGCRGECAPAPDRANQLSDAFGKTFQRLQEEGARRK